MKKYLLALLLLCAASRLHAIGDFKTLERNGNTVTLRDRQGQALQLKVCSPSTIRFRYSPDGRLERRSPSFAVVNEELCDIGAFDVNEFDGYVEFRTGKLRVRINKRPISVEVYDKYEKLLCGDYRDRGHSGNGTRKRAEKVLRQDEHIFGLGEKTGRMDRRVGNFRMWNSDRPGYGVTTDPIYKSIPFFMSSYNYAIFLDNTYKTDFHFGTVSPDSYTFEAPDGDFIYYLFAGGDYKELLGEYIALTGQPIMPPKWALGLAQCRGFLTSEKLSREIAGGYRNRGIPCDVIYQDIGWTDGLQTFEWRKENYHDPKKMLSDLAAMGFKVVVSQDPVVSQATARQWREADSLGYFVRDSRTGRSYDMPWPWGGNCGVVDFTIPEAAEWWGALQQKPLDDGVKGFWTDMGEPAWSNEEAVDRLFMQHRAGNHDEIHNVYGLTWDKIVTEQFEKRNPDRRIFQMTRSAYAGLQRYTFAWTGDSGNERNMLGGWAQFENQLPVILSAGLGGIPFITTDISGYCGEITDYAAAAELYVRWLQFGVFNPLSRIHHEGNTAVEPWLFGPEAERICREAIRLKYSLLPYIYTCAREAYDKGYPLMRPMFFEYPDDAEAINAESQFMFGGQILVAPVMKKGARSKRVYLPEGRWIDYNDRSRVYEGGEWISYPVALETIPVFVRAGAIISTQPVENYIGERDDCPVIFELFPSEGESGLFDLYEDDGVSLGYKRGEFARTSVACAWNKNGVEITVGARCAQGWTPPARNLEFVVRLLSAPRSVALNGRKEKKIWAYDKKNRELRIVIPDNGKENRIDVWAN